MAVTMTIRDVPDEVRNELAGRAARSGRSLQEYMRGTLIGLANKPDINDLMDEVRRRKRRSGRKIGSEAILAARDADRR